MKKVGKKTGTLADLAAPEVTAKITRPLISVKEIKEVAETAPREELDKAVAEAQKYISEIPGFMNRSISRIRAIQAASVEERVLRSSELETLIGSVLAHLEVNGNATPEEKLLNEAARQAYVMAIINNLQPYEQVILKAIDGNSRLPGFLKLGVLGEPNGKNANVVKVFGKTYAVNGGRASEIAYKLRQIIGEAYAKKEKAMRAKMEARATISVAELLAGKSGRAFITVPDDKDSDRFLPGGALLVRSDGKAVQVVEFFGHFQKIMNEITEAGTFLLVKSLNEQYLFLGEKMPEGTHRHVKILHSILRRGMAEELARKKKSQRPAAPAQGGNGEQKEKERLPVPEMLPLPVGDTAAMLH